MMSQSKNEFDAVYTDVQHIMDFHQSLGGTAPGRRADNLKSLNRSGLVLLCAAWEIYVESVLFESLTNHIQNASTPKDLDKAVTKLIAKKLANDKDERAWTRLAGEGWREVAISEGKRRVSELNTPSTRNVSSLFEELLGLAKIETEWRWQKASAAVVCERLEALITTRGDIAHGRQPDVSMLELRKHAECVNHLVDCTEYVLKDRNFIQ